MKKVRAKKHLGQHFLKDLSIARAIVDGLSGEGYEDVVEVGPGMGVLTQYLLPKKNYTTHVIELDRESVAYLQGKYPDLSPRIHSTDFLQLDLTKLTRGQFALIGNFPYNISSQILFKALEYKEQVPEVVGIRSSSNTCPIPFGLTRFTAFVFENVPRVECPKTVLVSLAYRMIVNFFVAEPKVELSVSISSATGSELNALLIVKN